MDCEMMSFTDPDAGTVCRLYRRKKGFVSVPHGSKDTEYLIKAAQTLFSTSIRTDGDGSYRIEK